MRVLDRVDELLGRPVSMRAMALLRVAVGLIVLVYLRPVLQDLGRGHFYRDVFHEPWVDWLPEPSRGVYVALMWTAFGAAVAMTLGLAARVATVTVFGIVAYDFFLTTTNFHHNRAYLVVVLGALAVVPCGRELSLDTWLRQRRGLPALDPRSPGWPLWLLRFEASAVYFASGFSKLIDPDWFGGTVTHLRVVSHLEDLRASPLPSWAVDVLADRGFHGVAAKAIVLTELSIALGFWSRRTRYVAVWVAICFHVSIQLSVSVETFSYLAISALAIWAVPRTRDRVLRVDPARHTAFAALVPALDWLARFEVVRASGPVAVVDRDGTVREGTAAVVYTFSRLPLTAWFALPLNLAFRHRVAPTPADVTGGTRAPVDA